MPWFGFLSSVALFYLHLLAKYLEQNSYRMSSFWTGSRCPILYMLCANMQNWNIINAKSLIKCKVNISQKVFCFENEQDTFLYSLCKHPTSYHIMSVPSENKVYFSLCAFFTIPLNLVKYNYIPLMHFSIIFTWSLRRCEAR